jgi:molybdenum cofactor synthesis domain-containing protein
VVKRYLDVVTLEEALDRMCSAFTPKPAVREIPLEESVGCISASPVFARYSVPEIHLSAMDGIAVRSTDTIGASEQRPVTLPEAARVNTGNIVPPGFDAVIMIEDVRVDGDRFTIRKPAAPWQHVRPAGEDIAESEMVIPERHRIRPHEIGALATYGVTRLQVYSVRAGIIPTGSELVTHGTKPAPGQVVESNTVMAAAWLESLGVRCIRYPITPDEPDLIREAISRAVDENDMAIVSAGSSAGTRDFTADSIADLGEVLIHGVAIKPGKPVIIGRVRQKPVIGMPGYPLSALTVLREIITPLVARYGLAVPDPVLQRARLTSTLHSDAGSDEFVLLSVGTIGGTWVASPQSRGSGVQMSGVRSNAYLRIPRQVEGFEAGEEVDTTLMVSRSEAGETLLLTGSHDPVLDYLANMVRSGGVDIHSTHTGSMGGIISLKKQDCHAAPMHLLAENGDYNVPFLSRYLPGERVTLICVAGRVQGIVSISGDIGIDDLPTHQFVNRQKGSGTRLLLDYELKKRGIDVSGIRGYDRELTTHIGVALAVKSGEADAGMCVYSAAKALSLPFQPVAQERYELAIRTENMDDPRITALLDTIRSDAFIRVLQDLGGYDSRETGVQRELP